MIPNMNLVLIMIILFTIFDIVNKIVVSRKVKRILEIDYNRWTKYDMMAVRNKMISRMRSKWKRHMLDEYNRIRGKLKSGSITEDEYIKIVRLLKG